MNKNRKAFVEALFRKDAEMKTIDLSRSVREKFGKGLLYAHVKQLREAFINGHFGRTWNELYREDMEFEAMKKATKSKSKAKSRGERRGKKKIVGRRDIDKDKISVAAFRNHMVIYRKADGMTYSENFNSRKRAEDMVQKLLDQGVPSSKIGYFKRSDYPEMRKAG